jgi:hypothetical protein
MGGLNGKYIKTYAPGSSEELSIDKHDEVVAAYNDLVTKFNALLAKMDADFADVTNAETDYASVIGAPTGDINTATEDLIPSPAQESI